MKIILSNFLIIGLLMGCNSSETPQSVTENYLSLMQKGDNSYTEYACIRDNLESETERLIAGMSSFQIQDITAEGKGSIIAQVIGIKDGDEIPFKLSIHETVDLYQKAQGFITEIKTESLQTQKTGQASNAIDKESDAIGQIPPLKSPERLDYSLKKFCVAESLGMGEI